MYGFTKGRIYKYTLQEALGRYILVMDNVCFEVHCRLLAGQCFG
jgi:hypothetical protein